MKELLSLTGGYPREQDYLLTLQTELLTFGNSLFNSLGFDMVLAGCQVTNNNNGTVNIAAGIVYIQGEALRFDGANNIASDGSKAFAKGAYTTSNPLQFGDGSTKNAYREAKISIINSDNTNITQIKVTTTLYNFKQYIQDTVANAEVKGAYKHIYDFDGTFLSNFDESGLGVTPRWIKWAIDNGNNGTPGSVGRALILAGNYTEPETGEVTVFEHGEHYGEAAHTNSVDETAKPRNNPTGFDGPRKKPADGGGEDILYVSGFNSTGTDAAEAHNNVGPVLAVYRVLKIED